MDAGASESANPEPAASVTRLLHEVAQGEDRAADRLLNAVYDELRKLANVRMAQEKPGQTIQATALVHEAYLRLVGDESARWENRGHFFAAAAEAMRRILVEQARRRNAVKHGGGLRRLDVTDTIIAMDDDSTDLVSLSEALDRLHDEDPQKAILVKLRFFTGMTIPQAASALDISHATAERWWTYSRVRLYQWINGQA